MKHIIREIPAAQADFGSYFDTDAFNEKSGDYCNTLFIVQENRGRLSGYNVEEYKRVKAEAENLIDGFQDVRDGVCDWDGRKLTYKAVMEDCGIKYSARTCRKLKQWSETADADSVLDIADYLSIKTGKYWTASGVHGYTQGAYCEVVYCAETNGTIARASGEIWLGCGTEYSVTDLDENGEEEETVSGYIVSDCQAISADAVKRMVCNWAGIRPEETVMEGEEPTQKTESIKPAA